MDLPWIGRELVGFLIHELQLNLKLLGELVVVAVVCTMLCLWAGLGDDGPAAVAWSVCYMVMVVLGVGLSRVGRDRYTRCRPDDILHTLSYLRSWGCWPHPGES